MTKQILGESGSPKPSSVHDIAARLAEPKHTRALATRWIDHLLVTPIQELLPPRPFALALAEGLRATAASEAFETWVQQQFHSFANASSSPEGSLADRLPLTLLGPLENAVSREVSPDPELVRAIVDHPPFHRILRHLLRSTSLEFGRRVWSSLSEGPKSPRRALGLAAKVAGVAKGVVSVVGNELERQLESRATAFVDEILASVVDMAIDDISKTENAAEMAAWRKNTLHALLCYPLSGYASEAKKFSPQHLSDDLLAAVRAISEIPSLATFAEETLESLYQQAPVQTLGDWLDGSGLENAWRQPIENLLSDHFSAFFASSSFIAWVEETESSDLDERNNS